MKHTEEPDDTQQWRSSVAPHRIPEVMPHDTAHRAPIDATQGTTQNTRRRTPRDSTRRAPRDSTRRTPRDSTRRTSRATRERDSKPSRKGLLLRIGIIAGAVILLAAVIAVIVGWQFISGIDKKMAFDKETSDALAQVLVTPESPDDPFYVLFLGSDSRDSYNPRAGRSDSIILARIDPVALKVSLLSIPRDTEIILEGYGTQKINAAFAYYGPAGSVKAVSNLCGVDIAHYVEVDFDGLVGIVDQLGGIDVKVPVDISYEDSFIPKGKQHLNGYNALAMCRCRNFPSGDYQRMKNQRIVLQAIARDVLASNITEMPGLASGLAECVWTDFSATSILDLLLKLREMDTNESLYMTTVPSHPNYHDGGSYIAIDQEEFAVLMEKFKAGLPL